MLNITPNPQTGSDTQLACPEQVYQQRLGSPELATESNHCSKDQRENHQDFDMGCFETDETAQSFRSSYTLSRQESIEDACASTAAHSADQ